MYGHWRYLSVPSEEEEGDGGRGEVGRTRRGALAVQAVTEERACLLRSVPDQLTITLETRIRGCG